MPAPVLTTGNSAIISSIDPVSIPFLSSVTLNRNTNSSVPSAAPLLASTASRVLRWAIAMNILGAWSGRLAAD